MPKGVYKRRKFPGDPEPFGGKRGQYDRSIRRGEKHKSGPRKPGAGRKPHVVGDTVMITVTVPRAEADKLHEEAKELGLTVSMLILLKLYPEA